MTADFERDITYVVEYDEVIHRRCNVTITLAADMAAGSTANAIEHACWSGETFNEVSGQTEIRLVSWEEKT